MDTVKCELVAKLEKAQAEAERLKVELDAEKQRVALYNEGLKTGKIMSYYMSGLVDGGLTRTQAFEVAKALMVSTTRR